MSETHNTRLSASYAIPEEPYDEGSDDNSESGSSYAGSHESIAALEMVIDELTKCFDSAKLDRAVASQMQLSGEIKAKQFEVNDAMKNVQESGGR